MARYWAPATGLATVHALEAFSGTAELVPDMVKLRGLGTLAQAAPAVFLR
jgi:hypothetical protein